MARFIGCDVIALGQYTSIVTRNATTLQLPHIGLTTGNSYTIALALEAIDRAARRTRPRCRRPPRSRWSGAVGQHRADLRGDPGAALSTDRAPRQQQAVGDPPPVAACRRACPAPRWRSTRRRSSRRTSCSRRPTRRSRFSAAEHFAPGAIVCDLSVPAAVRPEVRSRAPDVLVIGGGIARLPFGEDHGIVGFPLPPGQVYGCMAEAMLLGLEGIRDATFTGILPAEHVFRLAAMAKRHGFALAEYKTHLTMGGSAWRASRADAGVGAEAGWRKGRRAVRAAARRVSGAGIRLFAAGSGRGGQPARISARRPIRGHRRGRRRSSRLPGSSGRYLNLRTFEEVEQAVRAVPRLDVRRVGRRVLPPQRHRSARRCRWT